VTRRRPRLPVELRPGPELDRSRQRQHDPALSRSAPRSLTEQAGRPEHQRHQRERDAETGDDLDAQLTQLTAFRGFLGCLAGRCLSRTRLRDDTVASVLDRANEPLPTNRAADDVDRRLLGRQVDICLGNARHLRERLLNPPHTRRTGHPGHAECQLLLTHVVPGIGHGFLDGRQRDLAGIEPDGRRLGRQIDACLSDTRHFAQRLLNASHARCARHSAHRELELGEIPCGGCLRPGHGRGFDGCRTHRFRLHAWPRV